MFRQLPNSPSFPDLESEVLDFWRENKIYEASLEQRAGAPKFVFFEGPPTANGMPHPGHCLTRAIKDVFPRYKTMRGFYCQRKGGWDTHGLPVEVEVCKEMGIHSKEEIEEFGIEPFIHKCQASVWRYMKEWERLTDRLGFWIHLEEAYVTYHQSYVESVWWSLKSLFERGLLYQGHKIVWWWAQGGTALSSGEVGQGYREVKDPSVFVRFPLLDEPDTSLLVWTTTPWTLPSNQFAAVHPELDYVQVVDEAGNRLILAEALASVVADKAKQEFTVEKNFRGSDLLGKRYQPPFDFYHKDHADAVGELADGEKVPLYWRVVAADFVTTDSGSGVVHQAPAFGEVDYDVLLNEQARFADSGPQLMCAVGPDGKFTSEAPDFEGQWVKDADKPITRDLKQRGLLYHQEQYLHEYPFCWRADDDPLIQYPRHSWFIRTTKFKDAMLANNRQINWLPDHIQDGRFGNFLESNVDWALSRERYWGTPLPIWVCEETQQMEAIGSYDELLAKPGVSGTEVWEEAKANQPDLSDDLKVHKPYIDEVTYNSPFADGARMRRVTEVIDCWYDSGAMPFAQWGYPHRGEEDFASQFPADFISEALDQTRGWFYSQLAISTMMFGENGESATDTLYPHPFRNCIVLGLMLGEDGKKMSKKLRNYREPNEIFDRYGADALRWFFFANQAPWTPIHYKEKAIKDSLPEFLIRLWNVFAGFFCQYANLDGFAPEERLDGDVGQFGREQLSRARGYRPVADRPEIDRWVMSELNRTLSAVVAQMDNYENYPAAQAITQFVDALSNWYVRRSRDRFWSEDKSESNQDKLDAYWTLFECLTTTARMIAPFTPFLAETIWQTLSEPFGGRALKSVHLCDYPEADETLIDETLSERMELLREVASRGRRARTEAKLKVRQPLKNVEVILGTMSAHQEWLESHDELLRSELNVKSVEYPSDASQYIQWEVRPNFKLLGPKLGKQLPLLQKALKTASMDELAAQLDSKDKIDLEVDGGTLTLSRDDVELRLQAKEGWSAVGRDRSGSDTVVVISTEITPELQREGLARDVVRFVQDRRKTLDLERDARIHVGVETDSEELMTATNENRDYIMQETLADSLELSPLENTEAVEHAVGDIALKLFVSVV